MRRGKAGHQGFTFLECMAAIVVLAVGMVAVYRGFMVSLNAEDYFRQRLYADQLLSSQLEYGLARYSAGGDIALGVTDKVYPVVVNNHSLDFNLEMNVSEVGKLKNAIWVEFSVTWQAHGKNFRRTQKTFISRTTNQPEA